MARADLLLALVQSGAGGDDLAFRRAAEALIAEEENKRHNVLASQLTEALRRKRPAPLAVVAAGFARALAGGGAGAARVLDRSLSRAAFVAAQQVVWRWVCIRKFQTGKCLPGWNRSSSPH